MISSSLINLLSTRIEEQSLGTGFRVLPSVSGSSEVSCFFMFKSRFFCIGEGLDLVWSFYVSLSVSYFSVQLGGTHCPIQCQTVACYSVCKGATFVFFSSLSKGCKLQRQLYNTGITSLSRFESIFQSVQACCNET